MSNFARELFMKYELFMNDRQLNANIRFSHEQMILKS